MNIIDNAIKQGRTTLSEHESKQILSSYQIPVSRDILVHDAKDLFSACKEIDINPIIISDTKPVAVDALVILETASL